jgi:CRISPR-associated protein (TIGR02710 family)
MKTLFCTVGGQHTPVLVAIAGHAPDRVVFVCSGTDVATGTPGSRAEVETKNPSLPLEARLSEGSWEVLEVPADDPARAITIIDGRMAAAIAKGECVVDYTGGTKSMSAALFFVACQTPNVQVSLVTAPRSDLVRVAFGEYMRVLPHAVIHRRRLHEQVAACWDRFAYAEAEQVISSASPALRDETMDRWHTLSRGYALWDAWDHRGALERLRPFKKHTGALLPTLVLLASEGGTAPGSQSSDPGRWRLADAQRVADIVASAERRARRHEYDAAVLRVYRALEWVAQWTLRWDHEIETANVPKDSPIAHHSHLDEGGRLVVGCSKAWAAVADLPGPLQEVARSLGDGVRDLASRRNLSVLAHGDRALGRDDFEACRDAFKAKVWPAFLGASGVQEVQLPSVLP